MNDPVFNSFLKQQYEEGIALAKDSDILTVIPRREDPVKHYMLHFEAKGLVRNPDGSIIRTTGCDIGIFFPNDYLHRYTPNTVTWLFPFNVFHPNILPPVMCLGHIGPGTPLRDLIFQCYEIWTFQKVTMNEHDALNFKACKWARANPERIPADTRPLKRRRLSLKATPVET